MKQQPYAAGRPALPRAGFCSRQLPPQALHGQHRCCHRHHGHALASWTRVFQRTSFACRCTPHPHRLLRHIRPLTVDRSSAWQCLLPVHRRRAQGSLCRQAMLLPQRARSHAATPCFANLGSDLASARIKTFTSQRQQMLAEKEGSCTCAEKCAVAEALVGTQSQDPQHGWLGRGFDHENC